MTDSLFHRLCNAIAFANAGTLSEFRRVLERQSPLLATVTTRTAPAHNVLSLRGKKEAAAFTFAGALLPKARLKP
jgi:hypothetical protein